MGGAIAIHLDCAWTRVHRHHLETNRLRDLIAHPLFARKNCEPNMCPVEYQYGDIIGYPVFNRWIESHDGLVVSYFFERNKPHTSEIQSKNEQ